MHKKVAMMHASLKSMSFFFLMSTFQLQLCKLPPLSDNAVVYLTNCQTSDTGAAYSEVSMYLDVTQSFNGQNPDQYDDTSLGQILTWEGAEVKWQFPGGDPNTPDTLSESISANAQDPSVPTFSQVGCATYTEGFSGGAISIRFNCYKDTPRVLYTDTDHECSTVYYCRVTHDTRTVSGQSTPQWCLLHPTFTDSVEVREQLVAQLGHS